MHNLFPTIPERPTLPPWLTWTLAGTIDYDDPRVGGWRIVADVWQTAEGWAWAATASRYELETATLAELVDALAGGDSSAIVAGRKRKAGPCMGLADEATAKAGAEGWIGTLGVERA